MGIRALVTLTYVLVCGVLIPFLLPFGFASLLLLFPFTCGVIFVWTFEHERPRFRSSDIYFPPKRNYQSWNSIHGWPRAPNLFYECSQCQKSLPSQPSSPGECACGNLFIGPDHIGASNPTQVRLYEE